MYQKKVAEIIATEMSSLKQTILTYTKCIDLFADIDRYFVSKGKKKPKVIAALQDALKPSLKIYEKLFNIVGPNVEDFFIALNIPASAKVEAETDLNKVEHALINLVGSEQFFGLCQLRSEITFHFNHFHETLTQLFSELEKKDFDLSAYNKGQSSISVICAAVIQRTTKLLLFGKELQSMVDKGTHLHDLAIQIEAIAGAYTVLFNESDKVKDAFTGDVLSKGNTPAKDHTQQKSEIEKVLESIARLIAPYNQKGIDNLTPEERKEFDKCRDGQAALQVKLTALKKEQQLTTQDKASLEMLTKTSKVIPECKAKTKEILLAVYKKLNETAPPFKRTLTVHPAYVSSIVVPTETTSDEKTDSEGLGNAFRRRASSMKEFVSQKIVSKFKKTEKESSETSELPPVTNDSASATAATSISVDVSEKAEESSSSESSSDTSLKNSDEKTDLLDKLKGFGKGFGSSVKDLFKKKKKRKDSSELNTSEQQVSTTSEVGAATETSTSEVTRRLSDSKAPSKISERIAFFQGAIDEREQRLLEEANRLLKKLEAFSAKLAEGANSAAQTASPSILSRSRSKTIDLGKSSVNKNDAPNQQPSSTPRNGF